MVGQNTLKLYDINTVEQYYDMVILSEINGQMKQARKQYKKLSNEQKAEFLKYLKSNYSLQTIQDFEKYVLNMP